MGRIGSTPRVGLVCNCIDVSRQHFDRTFLALESSSPDRAHLTRGTDSREVAATVLLIMNDREENCAGLRTPRCNHTESRRHFPVAPVASIINDINISSRLQLKMSACFPVGNESLWGGIGCVGCGMNVRSEKFCYEVIIHEMGLFEF